MDCRPLKYYNSDAFNPKSYLSTYFLPTVAKEILQGSVIEPIRKLQSALCTEHLDGETLIDLSLGPMIHQLLPVCENFKDIFILDYNDRSIVELKKWMNKDPGAHDWSYVSKIVAEGGKKSPQEIEDMLRSKCKEYMKWDLAKENPASPKKIPKADCVLSMWTMECVAEDQNAYLRYLKNMLSLMKPKGHLIMFANLNTSYYMFGEDKFYSFCCSEDFLKRSLTEAGCTIKIFDPIEQNSSTGLYDTQRTMFSVCQKN